MTRDQAADGEGREGAWAQITCEEREALIDRLGRSYNGFSEESGICALSSLTDHDGQFGEPTVFTEWGYRETEEPVLRDQRWPDSPRSCEHHQWRPAHRKPILPRGKTTQQAAPR